MPVTGPPSRVVQVQAGVESFLREERPSCSVSVYASAHVRALTIDDALLTVAVEWSKDDILWNLAEQTVQSVQSGATVFVFAEAIGPEFLRLRFAIGQGRGTLSVATNMNLLDPRYRDNSAFRLSSSNMLKPWTTTS